MVQYSVLTVCLCVAWLLAMGLAPQNAQAHNVCPDPDYCLNNYCGIGDGDCEPGQCDEGYCASDVGAQYNLPAYYDVCEATDQGCSPGDYDYCLRCGPCGEGQGDCDSNSECQAGLTCVNDVGANYGWDAIVDVCQRPSPIPGGWHSLAWREDGSSCYRWAVAWNRQSEAQAERDAIAGCRSTSGCSASCTTKATWNTDHCIAVVECQGAGRVGGSYAFGTTSAEAENKARQLCSGGWSTVRITYSHCP